MALLKQINKLHQRLATASSFQPLIPLVPYAKWSTTYLALEIFLVDKEKLEWWIMKFNAKMLLNADYFVIEERKTRQNEIF